MRRSSSQLALCSWLTSWKVCIPSWSTAGKAGRCLEAENHRQRGDIVILRRLLSGCAMRPNLSQSPLGFLAKPLFLSPYLFRSRLDLFAVLFFTYRSVSLSPSSSFPLHHASSLSLPLSHPSIQPAFGQPSIGTSPGRDGVSPNLPPGSN